MNLSYLEIPDNSNFLIKTLKTLAPSSPPNPHHKTPKNPILKTLKYDIISLIWQKKKQKKQSMMQIQYKF
jgi:hypothetical protein